MANFRHYLSENELIANVNKYKSLRGFDFSEDLATAAASRVSEISDLLEDNEDSNGMRLLYSLVDSAESYLQRTNATEPSPVHKMRLTDEQFLALKEERDTNRRISHEALMSSLTAVNRYLFTNYEPGTDVPYGGACSLDPIFLSPMDRIAVGRWSCEMVIGMQMNEKKKGGQ